MPTFQEVITDRLVAQRTNLAEHESGFRRSGQYFPAGVGSGQSTLSAGGAAFAVNTLTTYAFLSGRGMTFDQIVYRINAGVATARARVGVYATDLTYYPTTLLVETGDTDASAAGSVVTAVPAMQLSPDTVYWLALLTGTAAPNFQTIGSFGQFSPLGYTQGLGPLQVGWTVALAYAALPAIFPGGAAIATGNVPTLALRIV